MPSYVVTGVSRGIGWAFISVLSADPNNTVIGLVRDNKAVTEAKVSEELQGRTNIHILEGDLRDYSSLQNAAAETAKITGGSLDYLIANAGLMSLIERFVPIGVLGEQPKVLEAELLELFNVNVVGNIHLFNLFVPLLLKGQAKKVLAISSGHAAMDLMAKLSIAIQPLYTISKAALNAAVAKFSAQYAKDGLLFMSVSPGMVETGFYDDITDEQKQVLGNLAGSFIEYAPHFKGASTPETAVRDVLSVLNNSSVENGDGGSFVPHTGTDSWL